MKLRSSGRGRRFSPVRGLIESTLSLAYLGGWPARAWARVPGATRVDLIERRFSFLPGASDRAPLRIGFVSDLHIGPTTPPHTIDNAFAILREAAPDVLLLGGDYVFLEATAAMANRLRALVASIDAPVKLAVLGNHDLWTDHGLIEQALRDGGAEVMVNEAARLPAPHADVAIVCLDDPWTGDPDPDTAFAAAGDAALRLVLCHAPDGYPFVRGRGAPLMMCGHTHGGQVALPSGPIVVHSHHGRRWPSGFHQVDDLTLFVSRGIGGVEVPFRAYAPPDVAIFTIAPALVPAPDVAQTWAHDKAR